LEDISATDLFILEETITGSCSFGGCFLIACSPTIAAMAPFLMACFQFIPSSTIVSVLTILSTWPKKRVPEIVAEGEVSMEVMEGLRESRDGGKYLIFDTSFITSFSFILIL